MILDRVDNSRAAARLPVFLHTALKFLQQSDLSTLAVGRHDIDGARVFALVDEYVTKPDRDCKWEAHRQHVDIQCVISGDERVGIASLYEARELVPYDPSRDVTFFEPATDEITLRPGWFAVFFPEDVHRPGGVLTSPCAVRKVVVKVAHPEK